MNNFKQRGFAHIFLIILLVLAVALGVYLVSQRTNLKPRADVSQSISQDPITAFILSTTACPLAPNEPCALSEPKDIALVGNTIPVHVLVRSDIDATNTYDAAIKFPTDLLEVTSIKFEEEVQYGRTEIPNHAGPITPIVGGGTEASGGGVGVTTPGQRTEFCAQVIVTACSQPADESNIAPECREFPSPCQVPPGWKITQPRNTNRYFIKSWITQPSADNNLGTVSLKGGLPTPGLKTTAPYPALMATIYFKVKKIGQATISFDDPLSTIYRDSDNQNILTKTYNLTLNLSEKLPPVGCDPNITNPSNQCPSGYYCRTRSSCQGDACTNVAGGDCAKISSLNKKGDLDADGKINLRDFSILLTKWGSAESEFDLNADGTVNIIDFSILFSNWQSDDLPSVTTTGTITGKVTAGPFCPNEPCQNQELKLKEFYLNHKLLIFDLSKDRSTPQKTIVISEDGTYETSLLAGDYEIKISPQVGINSEADSKTVTVTTGQTTTLSLNFDTGIR